MLELTEYQRERLELIEHKLKFVTDRPIKIIKSMEIENILNKLKELKINLR